MSPDYRWPDPDNNNPGTKFIQSLNVLANIRQMIGMASNKNEMCHDLVPDKKLNTVKKHETVNN
jgi:hypothetical protein